MTALATEPASPAETPEIPAFLELEITGFCQLTFFWIKDAAHEVPQTNFEWFRLCLAGDLAGRVPYEGPQSNPV